METQALKRELLKMREERELAIAMKMSAQEEVGTASCVCDPARPCSYATRSPHDFQPLTPAPVSSMRHACGKPPSRATRGPLTSAQ